MSADQKQNSNCSFWCSDHRITGSLSVLSVVSVGFLCKVNATNAWDHPGVCTHLYTTVSPKRQRGIRQSLTPMDAPESQPAHAAALNQSGFSPRRPLAPATMPCGSTPPPHLCSYASARHSGSPFRELRPCPEPAPATAATGPDRLSLPPVSPATRSSAGSARSA